jgi:hypothetical protein
MAHLVHAGRQPSRPFRDVYDRDTFWGNGSTAHLLDTDLDSDWLARGLNAAPHAADDAIGVMLTEFYRQHLEEYGTPPDWQTLQRHHRDAYRQFGADPRLIEAISNW